MIQGIPLGLVFGSIPYLLKTGGASFAALGLFSLSGYPYSLKLLWSPIVDSLFWRRVGRRKSWIIPMQTLIAFSFLFLSRRIDFLLHPENIYSATILFVGLVFICATQDIAVDGWALTILSPANIEYGSTAQTVGLNIGYFFSFTIFLALNSEEFCAKYLGLSGELLTLGPFLKFWGIFCLIATLCLLLFVNEEDAPESLPSSLRIAYSSLFQVFHISSVRSLIAVLLLYRIGFIAHESITALKYIEKGLKKEDMAIAVLIDFPFQIIFGYLAVRMSAKRPLNLWLTALIGRLALVLPGLLLVAFFPTDNLSTGYYLTIVGISILNSFVSTVMFVSLGAFFSSISDASIGGSYMTLLNTVTNLGGTWPRYFVMMGVDYFSLSQCSVRLDNGSIFPCHNEMGKEKCNQLGGICNVQRDGYYSVTIILLLIGIVTTFWIWRVVKRIAVVPHMYWKISNKPSPE